MPFYQRLKRQLLSRVWLTRSLLIIGIICGIFLLWKIVGKNIFNTGRTWYNQSNIVLPSHQGRTNFLLLGTAGGDHEGSDLTDSIIWVSVDHSGQDVLVFNVPRDLWVKSLQAKINTAFHFGFEKQATAGGILLAKSAVSEVLGQPVDYVAIINFAEFEKLIDALGGVDVEVERTFDDYKYPVVGRENDPCDACRYDHLHFEAGRRHMNGALALKFARSRHAEGEEGSDFARSVRQQKIILAIKNKILGSKIYLLSQFTSTIITDLPQDHYPAVVKLGINSLKAHVRTAGISDNLVYNPPLSKLQNFQWILLPKDNNPNVIFEYVTTLLNQK